jgi:hypothetical protein
MHADAGVPPFVECLDGLDRLLHIGLQLRSLEIHLFGLGVAALVLVADAQVEISVGVVRVQVNGLAELASRLFIVLRRPVRPWRLMNAVRFILLVS